MYDFDYSWPINHARSGEWHYHAKITHAQAKEIRGLYATGEVTQQQLAKDYGVSQNTISHVVNGITWKDGGQDDG